MHLEQKKVLIKKKTPYQESFFILCVFEKSTYYFSIASNSTSKIKVENGFIAPLSSAP